jgi:anti-sigma factor ChrR (cupin superfamily)
MSRELEDIHTHVALYALGGLSPQETGAFEAHLAGGCARCGAEVEALRAVAAELALAVPSRRPRPQVRARVLARISAPEGRAAFEHDGLQFVRSPRVDWQPCGLAGVEIKTLAVDAARGYRTLLVRMQPGAALPPHRHAGVEESYVIDGELLVSGVRMGAGDYCRAAANSIHHDVRTETGCVFIAVSCVHDELLR